MNHPDEELRKAVALFRYGLIADVLRLPLGSHDIRRALNEKAQRTYLIPGTRRTRVAVETMRDWLSLYRTGGLEALYPKPRSDRGLPRRVPPEVAEALVSLNTEQPALSVKALINAARARSVDHPLAPSTVHRLLSREGLLDKRPGEPAPTDPAALRLPRRRRAVDERCHARAEGRRRAPAPKDLPHRLPRRRHPGDSLHRLRPLREHHRLPARAQAGHRPARTPGSALYCDNGASYRSHQLALVCCRSSASRSSTPAPTSPRGREKSNAGSEPFAPPGCATSPPRPPQASTPSTAPCGPGSRASTTACWRLRKTAPIWRTAARVLWCSVGAHDDSERRVGVRPEVGLSLIAGVVVAVELFGVVVLHLMRDLEEEVGQLRRGLVGEVERGRR